MYAYSLRQKETERQRDTERKREKERDRKRQRKWTKRRRLQYFNFFLSFLFLNISSILLFIFFALLTGRYNSQEVRRDLKKNTENKQCIWLLNSSKDIYTYIIYIYINVYIYMRRHDRQAVDKHKPQRMHAAARKNPKP